MGVVVSYILDKIIRKKPRASNGSEVVFFTLQFLVMLSCSPMDFNFWL